MADKRSVFSGFDLDTGGGEELISGINLRLSASGGSIEAIGQKVMASSIPVVLASDHSNVNIALAASSATVTVDTELPAAVALTDNFATPTTSVMGAFGMVYDGAAWDFMRGTAADGVLVNLGANNDVTVTGTVTVDSELPAAAALTDNFSTPTTTVVGAFGMVYDGATWDFMRGTAVDGVLVNLGTNNDVTFSETPPTNPTTDYITSASVAAGAEANLDTADLPAKKLAQVTAWSSVAYRARVFLVNNSVEATEALAVGGGQAHMPWTWEPPHINYAVLGTSGGTDAFRVEFINLDDAQPADAHAVVMYQD